MNQMLEQRIANLMGDTSPEPMMMQMGGEVDAMPGAEQAVEQLLMARETAEDPTEQAQADKMIQASEIAAQSPLAELASQIAAAGRGPDTTLAHLTPGEVVLPPEMFESDQFETVVENRFRELDLDPEQYVVGMGIASLNPQTGLEEFGFFKKLGKSIKKFAKKIAPVAGPLANFIPGVGPIVAGAIGAATNVVGGKGLKGALSGALGGYGTGKLIGGIGGLSGTTGKAFTDLGPIGKIQKIFSGGKSGIASLFGGGQGLPAGGGVMQLDATGNPQGLIEALQQGSVLPAGGGVMQLDAQGNPVGLIESLQKGLSEGLSPEQILKQVEPEKRSGFMQFLDDKLGIDPSGGGIFSLVGGGKDGKGGLGGLLGGMGGLGGLGAAGIAGLLGKLAYDEAKNRRGVARTPLTTMDAMGRFNIEQEIARRTGQGDVDPREFGLMSRGTIPTLSGGRKRPEEPPELREVRPYRGSGDGLPQVPQVMMNGGMVMPMRYAEGGGVEMEEFKAMDGKINGPGTETSDDIPAMLSDGEFVMKSQAVRGAGAFDLSKGKGGIITLTPNGEESRDRGTQIMYQMMDMFSNQARAS